MANKAILAGASGLIGSALLEILLQQSDYNEVLVLVRKKLPFHHPKLTQLEVNFDELGKYSSQISGHALFCCLGSTRKKTPKLDDYAKVDFDYPLQLAEMALANGMEQYHLVSALGANKDSANFYSKMKGETEDAIKLVGLPCLHIYQPSLLIGDRKEKRVGEKAFIVIMRFINPLLIGKLKKYRSIAAKTVAMTMFKNSLKTEKGIFIYPSDKII